MNNLYNLIVNTFLTNFGKNQFCNYIDMVKLVQNNIYYKIDLKKALLFAFSEHLLNNVTIPKFVPNSKNIITGHLGNCIYNVFGKTLEDSQVFYFNYVGYNNFYISIVDGSIWYVPLQREPVRLYKGDDTYKYMCLLILKNQFFVDENYLVGVNNE